MIGTLVLTGELLRLVQQKGAISGWPCRRPSPILAELNVTTQWAPIWSQCTNFILSAVWHTAHIDMRANWTRVFVG